MLVKSAKKGIRPQVRELQTDKRTELFVKLNGLMSKKVHIPLGCEPFWLSRFQNQPKSALEMKAFHV